MQSEVSLDAEILQIFLMVHYDPERFNPEDSDVAILPEGSESMSESEDLPAVNQKVLTEKVSYSQSQVSKKLKKWRKEGYVHKGAGRPNKWWLNTDEANELSEDVLGRKFLEADRMINRIIGIVEGSGYPEESLSYQKKKDILKKSKEVLRGRLGEEIDKPDSLSQTEIDILWGELIRYLKIGDKDDPSTWARYNLSVGVEERDGEKVLPLANAEEIVEKGC